MTKITGFTGTSSRGSTDPLSAFLITFNCGHTGRIPNLGLASQAYNVGEALHCYECNKDRTITSVALLTATDESDESS